MNNEITPPLKLVQTWLDDWYNTKAKHDELLTFIATQAARWGADQELEACCEWLFLNRWDQPANELHAARRPKPPSLKEQALEDFDGLMSELDGAGNYSNCAERIRRALGQLPD